MTSCWAAEEKCCVHCNKGDIQQGFGPRTFILCACCQDRGSHVECEEKATGTCTLLFRTLDLVKADTELMPKQLGYTLSSVLACDDALRLALQVSQCLHRHWKWAMTGFAAK